MCSTSVITGKMTRVFTFMVIFIISVFMFKGVLPNIADFLSFHAIPAVRLLIVSFSSLQC